MSWFSFNKKAEQTPEDEYKEQLNQLQKLGYTDRTNNVALLKAHKGNANQVIQAYVSQSQKTAAAKKKTSSSVHAQSPPAHKTKTATAVSSKVSKPSAVSKPKARAAQASSSQSQTVAAKSSVQPPKQPAAQTSAAQKTQLKTQTVKTQQPKPKPASTTAKTAAGAAVKPAPPKQQAKPAATVAKPKTSVAATPVVKPSQPKPKPKPASTTAASSQSPTTAKTATAAVKPAPPKQRAQSSLAWKVAKPAVAATPVVKKSASVMDTPTTWNCKACGMKNPIANWKCTACFRLMQSKRKPADKQSTEEVLPYTLSDCVPVTMNALVQDKGLVLKTDVAVPMPSEDELLIRSCAVSIGGGQDDTPGYEAAGLVVGVGTKCRFRIGDRVAIEHRCYSGGDDDESQPVDAGAGFGEYFVVKQGDAYRLKADVSWRDAAMLGSLSVAYHACQQVDLNVSRTLPQDTVLIIGCGLIGCMAVAVAKNMARTCKVIACDASDERLELATQMGADVVFNVKTMTTTLEQKILELTDGVGVGKLMECSGDTSTIEKSLLCLRKGGSLCLVGVPKHPITFANPMQDLVFRCVQIRSAYGRRLFSTWNKSEQLVASKKISLEPLMSQVLKMSEFGRGYKAIESRQALNVVFDLTES